MYMASFGTLAYFIVQALASGAEAYSKEYTAEAASQLDDMFLFIPARRILELALACALTCFIVAFLAAGGFSRVAFARGLVLGLAAASLGWNIPTWILRIVRQRRLRRFNEQLVSSLVTMSNALKAGFSVLQAFESVIKEKQNPIAQEFNVFMHQVRVGMSLEDALAHMQERVASDDLALMVGAVETARQTGGNLTEVFEKIAQTIRERMRIEIRIRTLTAQGRLQGWVVGAMPFLLGGIMMVMDPRMMTSFFYSFIGLGVLGLILVLEVAGMLVIRRIVNIDV